MYTDPRYFELFVSGSEYQHSNLFELVRSRFEQSNSLNSSNSSDHSCRSKQQNRWLRLTENSKWRIRTQQTTLFNRIWYFGVFENPAYEFDDKIQNQKWRKPYGKQISKYDLISMKFGTRRVSTSLIARINLTFKKANLV